MPAAAGDRAGRLKTEDLTASSSARTVPVGSLSSVDVELIDEPTELDSGMLSTLASERAASTGRQGGAEAGRLTPEGSRPGTKAAADGRRVELGPKRVG